MFAYMRLLMVEESSGQRTVLEDFNSNLDINKLNKNKQFYSIHR